MYDNYCFFFKCSPLSSSYNRKAYKEFLGVYIMGKGVLNLRKLDKPTVAYALWKFYGKGLTKKQVQRMYDEGLQISFEGNGPYGTRHLNYALFHKDNGKEVGKLRVKCDFSTANHNEIMRKNPYNSLVGGTLSEGRFSGYSPTWFKEAPKGSPAHDLGESINEVMLKEFNISI